MCIPGSTRPSLNATCAASCALDELEGLFDEAQIERAETPLNPDLAAGVLERVLPPFNALNDQAWTLSAYVYAFRRSICATNTRRRA